MLTSKNVPEITIMPSAVSGGEQRKPLYCWMMQVHEESVLESEDHGDDFESVPAALAHAYTVFEDLVHTRKLYPANDVQAFAVTIKLK